MVDTHIANGRGRSLSPAVDALAAQAGAAAAAAVEAAEVARVAAELLEANKAELRKGSDELIIYNESRLALVRADRDQWVDAQIEMLSMKQDAILDALVSLLGGDKEYLFLMYGLTFQVALSRHLDQLFPPPEEATLSADAEPEMTDG